MRENTPPTSPYNSNDDEELIGDDEYLEEVTLEELLGEDNLEGEKKN